MLANRKGRHGHGRRQQQVVIIKEVRAPPLVPVNIRQRAGQIRRRVLRRRLKSVPHIVSQFVPALGVKSLVCGIGRRAEHRGKGRKRIAFNFGRGFLYDSPHFLENLRRRPRRLRHFRVNGGIAQVLAPGNAPPGHAALQPGRIIGRRRGDGIRVPGVRPGQNLQQQGRIRHSARHGAGLGKVVDRRPAVAPIPGHAPLRRLDARNPAKTGGYADAAPAVAARSQRAQPGSQRRRRAPAAAPGRVPRVPGIAARFAHQIFGGA